MYVNIDTLLFSYDKKTNVLKEVSLSMEKGEIVAILGSSGSGKSTLLRVLSGLETAKEGSVEVDGEILCCQKYLLASEKRGVGMVFQDYALFPHMTVEKNIAYGLGKLPKPLREERLIAMLSLVNMEAYRKRYPHELSGGQQQRVALARALAPNPKILLLDEPFSNLDADLKLKIRKELRGIIKGTQMTSIVVTHDDADARAIADRIITLEDGRIIHEERLV